MLSQQLHPYRGPCTGLAILFQLGAEAMEDLGGQQLIDHPDEFTDAEVVIIDGGEDLPHQVIQHPLHGGQNNAHSCFRRQGEKKERRL